MHVKSSFADSAHAPVDITSPVADQHASIDANCVVHSRTAAARHKRKHSVVRARERRAKGWQHTLARPNLQLFDMHPASPTSCVASHPQSTPSKTKQKARKYQQRAHATNEPAGAPPSESKQAVGGLQKSRRSRCGTGRRATCVHVAGTVMGACTGCGGKSPGNGLSAQHRDLSSSFPRHPPSSATRPLLPHTTCSSATRRHGRPHRSQQEQLRYVSQLGLRWQGRVIESQ